MEAAVSNLVHDWMKRNEEIASAQDADVEATTREDWDLELDPTYRKAAAMPSLTPPPSVILPMEDDHNYPEETSDFLRETASIRMDKFSLRRLFDNTVTIPTLKGIFDLTESIK